MTFLRELKDRRFFRIVVAYLAAGWIGLEVVDQVTTQGVLPDVVYEVALIWYLCGIPAAMILGWYHGEKGHQRATVVEVSLLAGVLILGLTASAGTVGDELRLRVRARAAAESALDLRRVAVLYFRDLTPGGEAQHLADGLTESLIAELKTVRGLDVVSRNGVGQFRGSELRRDSIARLLGTGTLVDGSIEQLGDDRMRVTVRLADGEADAEFERVGFEVRRDELGSARDQLARETALLLRKWLGEEVRTRRNRVDTESVAAWALYQRGERARKDAEAALRHGDSHAAEEAFTRADGLLAQAEVVDATWLDPTVLRGRIAYRRARIAHEMHAAAEQIAAGLAHVDRALAIDPSHAEALEVRGTLRYLHHLMGFEHDPARADAWLSDARKDLERAVQLDPTLASAHAILSHLYGRLGDRPSLVLAGRRAYEEDAYVDNAETVLWRILNGSYALEQFAETRRWCEEAARRFPEDPRFIACQLLVMTTPAGEADPNRAWKLLARLESLPPGPQGEWERLRGELYVAGVLARAGLADSARAVLSRVRGRVSPEVDPDRWLYALEAYLRTELGDDDEAIELLKRYAAVNPGEAFDHNWWWRDLQDHPRWAELMVLTGNGHH